MLVAVAAADAPVIALRLPLPIQLPRLAAPGHKANQRSACGCSACEEPLCLQFWLPWLGVSALEYKISKLQAPCTLEKKFSAIKYKNLEFEGSRYSATEDFTEKKYKNLDLEDALYSSRVQSV